MMNLWACLEWVFLKSFSKKFLKNLEWRLRNLDTGPRSFKIMIAIKKFPRTAEMKAGIGAILSSRMAYGIAPLSSVMGSIARMKVRISFFIVM